MALILTKAGLAALVEAEESGTKLQATHMALGDGDGDGSVPEHTTSSPSLINEVWRGALQSITVNEQGDTDAGKQVVFEAHVPINAGGWYIREVALYAGDVLLAIGTHPVMWKPAPEEPTKMEHVIKAPVTFGNAGVVSLIVDPAVVLASQKFVNGKINTHDSDDSAHTDLRELLGGHNHDSAYYTQAQVDALISLSGVPRGGCIHFDGAVNSEGRPLDPVTGEPMMAFGACDGRTYETPDGRQVTTVNARDRFIVVSGGKYAVGATGGAEFVTTSTQQTAAHEHSLLASLPGTNVGAGGNRRYVSALSYEQSPLGHISSVGGSQAHENRPPYIGLFLIKRL